MAKQTTKSAANDIQSLFDPKSYQDSLKTMTQTGERMSSIFIDAATRSTDITTEATHESLSNLRELTAMRDDMSDYGKAFSDVMQRQMDLIGRTMQAYAELGQKTGSETGELASQAGEQVMQTAAANVDTATDKAGAAAEKATKKAA